MDVVVEDEVLERAYAFVRSNGSRLTRALAGHASGRTGIDDSLKDLLLLKNPDGGWRGLDSDMEASLSSISQTYVGLKWLYWLRPTDSAPVDRTVEFLRRSQHPDGY